jgi:glycosyltransferase involved in cell wall biosynthesis
LRIVFLHNGSDVYGASRSLFRLSSRLVQDGNTVLVLLPYQGPLVDKLRAAHVAVDIVPGIPVLRRYHFLGFTGIIKLVLSIPVSVIHLLSIFLKFKPDIVHSNSATIFSAGIAAKLCGVKHFWHIRESFYEFQTIWKYYQWIMWLFSVRIIAVSDSIRNEFKPYIRRRKVVTLHNGFPREEFDEVKEPDAESFKNKYDLQDSITVGVIGRIRFERKGQDVFVKAASLVKKSVPHVHYVIIGSPFPGNESHLEKLKVLINELQLQNHVHVIGEIEDPRAAMKSLDVVVLPSGTPEPFGGVVIEAMALGKPVIGTSIGGTVEQIEEGVTGFLVPPNDYQAMADAMEKLLKDKKLRIQMGLNGYQRFINLFEFNQFYEKITALYKDALSPAGKKIS